MRLSWVILVKALSLVGIAGGAKWTSWAQPALDLKNWEISDRDQ